MRRSFPIRRLCGAIAATAVTMAFAIPVAAGVGAVPEAYFPEALGPIQNPNSQLVYCSTESYSFAGNIGWPVTCGRVTGYVRTHPQQPGRKVDVEALVFRVSHASDPERIVSVPISGQTQSPYTIHDLLQMGTRDYRRLQRAAAEVLGLSLDAGGVSLVLLGFGAREVPLYSGILPSTVLRATPAAARVCVYDVASMRHWVTDDYRNESVVSRVTCVRGAETEIFEDVRCDFAVGARPQSAEECLNR